MRPSEWAMRREEGLLTTSPGEWPTKEQEEEEPALMMPHDFKVNQK